MILQGNIFLPAIFFASSFHLYGLRDELALTNIANHAVRARLRYLRPPGRMRVLPPLQTRLRRSLAPLPAPR